jgi:ppGpp synthetase/RelA/SpoT-type nucleotidyltranferase
MNKSSDTFLERLEFSEAERNYREQVQRVEAKVDELRRSGKPEDQPEIERLKSECKQWSVLASDAHCRWCRLVAKERAAT